MRYVTARYRQESRDRAYRVYISDSLKVIGGLNIRYVDMIDSRTETRSADEIIEGISNHLEQIGKEDDE